MKIRLKFMLWLYDWSQSLYTRLFKRKKESWGMTKERLNDYPEGTLGKALGNFYAKNGFDIMPKLENHDVFHVITETGTEIQDEIAMQYLLYGNGKRSVYMFSMIIIGTMVYPEFIYYYRSHFQKGKSKLTFFNVDFKPLLGMKVDEVKAKF